MGKLYQRDGKWGIDYRDAKGKRVRRVVASDRDVASHLLGEALSAVEKVKAGMVQADPCEAKRPLQEHVDAYVTEMRRKGRDSMYIYTTGTRRALSLNECRALMDAAPEERRVCYLILLYTGLRRSEAAAISWGHVHLDVANPYIELPGSITKSGRPESVPLVADAAEALRARRGQPSQAVFESIPSMEAFRADLKAAGIPDADERGRKVVLHSLRHSLATMLAQSNVPPAIAMKILRHRDIRLTLQHYTDDSMLPVAAAMASLPSLNAAPTATRKLAAN